MIIKFIVSILLIPMFCLGQGKYIEINNFPDFRTIQKIKNEISAKSYKILIYQPSSDSSEITSILFVHKNDFTNFWVIKHDTVVRSGVLMTNGIFSYKDYLKTGATKKEGDLSFVPPLMNGIETVNLIYQDPKVKFYFEFGKNVTGYSPNPTCERYRREWISIIRKELSMNQIL